MNNLVTSFSGEKDNLLNRIIIQLIYVDLFKYKKVIKKKAECVGSKKLC